MSKVWLNSLREELPPISDDNVLDLIFDSIKIPKAGEVYDFYGSAFGWSGTYYVVEYTPSVYWGQKNTIDGNGMVALLCVAHVLPIAVGKTTFLSARAGEFPKPGMHVLLGEFE